MKKKKILFLINSLDTGGSERVVATLSEKLSKKCDVKIVTIKNVNKQDISVPIISLTNFKSNVGPFLLTNFLIKKFKNLVDAEKPDTVISFLELSNIINIKAKEKSKKKYKCIISVRANPSYVYKNGIYGLIFRNLIKKYYHLADLVITNSRLSADDLFKNFHVSHDKLKVIYNPLDISKIEAKGMQELPIKFQDLFNGKNKIIVSVGRLTYLKGQDHLLEAFNLLHKEIPNTKLLLVGDGELKSYLESGVKKLGLKGSVIFAGEQKNPYAFIARSNLFVFTSLYEGFPNAVLEAFACKVPVVSVDCRSGPREMIAPDSDPFHEAKGIEMARHGVLVPPFGYLKDKNEITKREKLLKEAMVNVLNNRRVLEKYRKSGFERAKSFESVKIADEFYRVGVK